MTEQAKTEKPSLKNLFTQTNEDGELKLPSIDEVKAALEAGADVNEPLDYCGTTAVECAAERGHVELLNLMLEHDADLGNGIGLRCLTSAICKLKRVHNDVNRNNYDKIIRLLISHGANINERNERHKTEFMKWVEDLYPRDKEILSLMLKYGADINVQDEMGRTAFMYALKWYKHRGNNWSDDVKFFVENGADLTLRDIYGFTGFDYINFYDAPLDVKQYVGLAMQGPSENVTSTQGGNLLHGVLRELRYADDENLVEELVQYLITSGIEVNARDSKGRTPLMIAMAESPAEHLVPLLLKHGADPTLRDANGFTALNYAQFSDASPEVLELLTPKD